ncbi:MAG: DUF808 family protein, partial [Proteobacteria bacterium]
VVAETTDDRDAEKTKVKSAVTTDFILSVEIVIIALGSVLDKSLTIQILTVSVVALLATVGVYGIVALIVRMDDAGLSLMKKSPEKGLLNSIGNLLVKALPWIIKLLAFVGTIALLAEYRGWSVVEAKERVYRNYQSLFEKPKVQ